VRPGNSITYDGPIDSIRKGLSGIRDSQIESVQKICTVCHLVQAERIGECIQAWSDQSRKDEIVAKIQLQSTGFNEQLSEGLETCFVSREKISFSV